MIIDGKDLILGRVACIVAKKALCGEEVTLLNCEHIVISGDPVVVIGKALHERARGNSTYGPFISRAPDRWVRRVIRRMLPARTNRGMTAFRRTMCYVGIPKEFEGKEIETVKDAHVSRLKTLKYTSVGLICKQLGGKQ